MTEPKHGAAYLDRDVLRELFGYLNFSSGTPDSGFRRNFNLVYSSYSSACGRESFPGFLLTELENLGVRADVFRDAHQARSVIGIIFERFLPAYRAHHSDLLFHLPETDFYHPFLLVRFFEAVLAEYGDGANVEEVVRRAIRGVNDFLGFRPVAVLDNDRRMEPYGHEAFCPLPIYLQDAGVASGPYHDLIDRMLEFMKEVPEELRLDAYFDLDRLSELAIDLRAHDHMHPVNKRTNYMFGEWDPHRIDNNGFYRRFILRKIIVDAMVNWIELQTDLPLEERLHDAAAVLCGTMLMASSISGAGPDTHSSDVSLTTLLPRVARQRDGYYDQLLKSLVGPRGERLRRLAEQTRQPFGHVRHHLNMFLASYGAQQIQHRQLAYLYARMGHTQAARQEAAIIPSVSGRFECEIQWRTSMTRIMLQRGELDRAVLLLFEIEDLFDRGIDCGAFVDPWNVLGFQAQFPLFSAREDSVPDQRVDTLLALKENSFGLFSWAMCEAASRGERVVLEKLSAGFLKSAEAWDRYATPSVEELLKVFGRDSWESAMHVSTALTEWRQAGESAGDISFWRQHVEQFQSAKSYSQVVAALLQTGDHVASMGLLMQWLDQAEDVGLENGTHSINVHLLEWMQLVLYGVPERNLPGLDDEQKWIAVRRLFDFLEVNAGIFWHVPDLTGMLSGLELSRNGEETDGHELDEDLEDSDPDDVDDDEERDILGAAWDDMVFQGSSEDGVESDTLDSGFNPGNTEFEILSRHLEPRLRFLMTVGRLWQMAGAELASSAALVESQPERQEKLVEWHGVVVQFRRQLAALLNDIWLHDIEMTTGDLDANVEYDVQLQTKYFLMHSIIATSIGFEVAERTLGACLASSVDVSPDGPDRYIVDVYRGIFRRDANAVMKVLPDLMESISGQPLLYVPFDNDGIPENILRARALQTLIRFLLEQLPRLGLLRQTFELLCQAHQMELTMRPGGLAVTEFDRLFRTALKNSLLAIVQSSVAWDDGDFPPEQLVEMVGQIVGKYRRQWVRHSKTMRLSTVEELRDESVAECTREFVEDYGADLFHARNLTLGNIRAILHHGVDTYLDYLEETQDPLRPMKLLDDLSSGEITEDEAAESLELIYEIVVDKFDRFLEYNTTTTQSDYGERFFSLLEFLSLEAAYDRESWELTPFRIAHRVLADGGLTDAAMQWEQRVERRTRRSATGYLKQLQALEQKFGMQLPSIADHLNEQFVKPLAVNRMLALVAQAREEAERSVDPPPRFLELKREINAYLEGMSGSGIDVPQWLRRLERQLDGVDGPAAMAEQDTEIPVDLPPLMLSRDSVEGELQDWDDETLSGGGRA